MPEEKKEPEIKVETAKVPAEELELPSSNKWFVLSLIAVASIFVLIIAGIRVFDSLTGQIITIDELHKKNLDGGLKQDQGYTYNGYSFVFTDGLWWTQAVINNRKVNPGMHFGPKELENVTVSGKLTNASFEKPELYISIDPIQSDKYTALAVSELSNSLISLIQKPMTAACSFNETTACIDRPIVNCQNKDKAVIQLIPESFPKVEMEGNCVKIFGKGMELVKAAERFLYRFYGIMI
ncbi:MAG TPA: hypothetical protein VJG31_01130 [Candidatus Nanoarchaeia archaeon]|nr:hypothetical protein [Candidatus Nanoarchaeia archaeon]